MDDQGLTRRESLLRLGGLAAGALGAGALLGDEAGAGDGPRAVAAGLVACVLSPEMTAGPFALDRDKLRRDIREGKPGVPLNLRTTVIDVSTCKPISGAAVDIWHCDAGGTYSGFAQEGTAGRTFLRGIQKTDRNGVALFKTIYPGWYPGRTVHIHAKVHLDKRTVLTTQFYFDDGFTDGVFSLEPYSGDTGRDAFNDSDSLYERDLELTLSKEDGAYLGLITLDVASA